MARNDILVRVTHVSGLATCEVCSRLISWLYSWRDLDRVSELRCPCCKGLCNVEVGSAVPLLEVGNQVRVVG